MYKIFPYPLSAPTHAYLFHYQHPKPECAFILIIEPTSLSPKVHGLRYGSLLGLYIQWIWANV